MKTPCCFYLYRVLKLLSTGCGSDDLSALALWGADALHPPCVGRCQAPQINLHLAICQPTHLRCAPLTASVTSRLRRSLVVGDLRSVGTTSKSLNLVEVLGECNASRRRAAVVMTPARFCCERILCLMPYRVLKLLSTGCGSAIFKQSWLHATNKCPLRVIL